MNTGHRRFHGRQISSDMVGGSECVGLPIVPNLVMDRTANALVVVRTYGNLIVVDASPSTNYTKVLRVTTSQLPTAHGACFLLSVGRAGIYHECNKK